MKNRSAPSMMMWLAAGLAVLLVALAVLQYRWLGQVNEAEREQLRTSLQRRAQEFATELHLELARAFATFQSAPVNEDQDVAARLATSWAQWTRDARYPRLVHDLYFVEPATGSTPEHFARFNPQSGALEPAEWPATLAPLRARFAAETTQAPTQSGNVTTMIRRHAPLADDVPALVIPSIRLRSHDTKDAGIAVFTLQSAIAYTIATLDLDYLRLDLLPALTERHFNPSGGRSDFIVSVVRTRTPSEIFFQSEPSAINAGAADLRQPVLELRPEEMGRVLLEQQTSRGRGGQLGPAVAGALSGMRATQKNESMQMRFTLGTQKTDVVARTGSMGGPAAWQLLVTHRAGSVDAAIRTARTRNLSISFGILLLFGASIGLLVVSAERARRLAERQMEFVAAVTHELRTPLAVIRSAGENLADGVVSDRPQVEKYGRLIEEQGRSLSDTVEQVLAFAGAENGQRIAAPQRIDVSDALTRVIETARQLAGPSFTFERDIEHSLPAVNGHPDALRRAFQNLIDNAVKYCGQARWMKVSASVRGRDVVVSVADRGIGIESSEQRHVFEPFYRGRQATAAQIHGSGLGLSLVKRIVQAHGGQVSLASAPGRGSTFTVTLPIAPPEANPCPEFSSSKTNPASS